VGSDDRLRGAPTLTPDERRTVLVVGAVPVVLVGLVLAVLVGLGRLAVVDLVVGVVLYGGLLGLTVGVLAHERAVADHCPRCGAPGARGAARCAACDYDLRRRPVYACEERHEVTRDPGLCRCGRRLIEREPAAGLGRSVRRSLWAGAWLLALLVGTSLLLRLAG
jgi:hypothetical protein